MKDYKRLTKNDWHNAKFDVAVNKGHRAVLHRLWDIENRIESGELVDRNEYLDRFMAAKGISRLTDKEIEFFAKHNARVRENADAEIARLTAENAALQKRLDNAVELPFIHKFHIEDTKGNAVTLYQLVYIDDDNSIITEIDNSEERIEARLEELKGGKE